MSDHNDRFFRGIEDELDLPGTNTQSTRRIAMTMNVSQICSNARALIVREGWWRKGDGNTDRGGYCILDALYCAAHPNAHDRLAGDNPLYLEAVQEVQVTLHENRWFALDRWNDDPNRAMQDVLDVLQQTAIRTDPLVLVFR